MLEETRHIICIWLLKIWKITHCNATYNTEQTHVCGRKINPQKHSLTTLSWWCHRCIDINVSSFHCFLPVQPPITAAALAHGSRWPEQIRKQRASQCRNAVWLTVTVGKKTEIKQYYLQASPWHWQSVSGMVSEGYECSVNACRHYLHLLCVFIRFVHSLNSPHTFLRRTVAARGGVQKSSIALGRYRNNNTSYFSIFKHDNQPVGPVHPGTEDQPMSHKAEILKTRDTFRFLDDL